MDYLLDRLGNRGFEHLAQALVVKYLGVRTVVFGDGPDGGREATYQGDVLFRSGAESVDWSGYTVIQAKFRSSRKADDGQWLLAQVKAEIEGFTREGSPRTLPENYLLITNVSLGSSPESGSKDKVFRELGRICRAHRVMVWDYSQLCALLDAAPEITRTYLATIAPGDVLSEVMTFFSKKAPDFDAVIGRYLQEELLRDQHANLEHAGHAPEDRVPIASVFIDLPVSRGANLGPDSWKGFIDDVLKASSEARATTGEFLEGELGELAESSRTSNHLTAVIGGPGQGKTTLTQFACQLYRAALLRDRTSLTSEAKTVLRQVLNWSEADSLDLPQVRRFPVRVTLSRFADAIATAESPLSLLSYIVQQIEEASDRKLERDDLRSWLQEYPWLVILDGLDEVPASGNREALLEKIRSFNIEVSELDADVLTIVTTRPQGYTGELERQGYVHHYLMPLDARTALRYGDRLAAVRFGENKDRVEKIRERLRSAIESPVSARLMTSPLQVTIMTVLVDRHGEAPRARWNLFSYYYDAICQREIERDLPTGRVIRERKNHVDAIHRQTGLALQSLAERESNANSKLTTEQFRMIVRHYLETEEFEGEALDEVEGEILEAAAHRLVFLVGLEEGSVGFEIRSLQEFMAAEGLMDGSDEAVSSRLSTIATSPNWRNVFLFCAGKCFADRRHLRETIIGIAASLNEADTLCSATLAGSGLALDVLLEGSVIDQPKYSKALCRHASRLVRGDPDVDQARLAEISAGELEAILREKMLDALMEPEHSARLGAWNFLFAASASGTAWATQLAVEQWPETQPERDEIISSISPENAPELQLVELVAESAANSDPGPGYFTPLLRICSEHADAPEWLKAVLGLGMTARSQVAVQVGQVLSGNVFLTTVEAFADGPAHALAEIPGEHEGWDLAREIGKFASTPCRESAARVISTLASRLDALPEYQHEQLLSQFAGWVSWPIGNAVYELSTVDDILEVARRMENGGFGDLDAWKEEEASWEVDTVELLADLMSADDFSGTAPAHRFPIGSVTHWSIDRREGVPNDSVVELLEQLPERTGAVFVSALLTSLDYLIGRGSGAGITLDDWVKIRACADELPNDDRAVAFLTLTVDQLVQPLEWSSALDQMATLFGHLPHSPYFIGFERPDFAAKIANSIDQGERREGIIRLAESVGALRRITRLFDYTPSNEEPQLTYAALFLKIAKEEPRPQLAGKLIAEAFSNRKSLLLRFVMDLDEMGSTSNWIEQMLHAVDESWSDDPRRNENLVSAMSYVIDRRLSGISDPTNWKELEIALPELSRLDQPSVA